MRKIPTVFVRDEEQRSRVLDKITPGCEWVFADNNLAVATRKYDGTCIKLSRSGHWYARREVKQGRRVPDDFTVVSYDEVTMKYIGWEPIEQSGFHKWFCEALDLLAEQNLVHSLGHGTYELCGPKVNGNPEGYEVHKLIKHSAAETLLPIAPVSMSPRYKLNYDVIKAWVCQLPYEGIVWHHPDGRMAKIKRRDFGCPR